jgi:hypothetical protein
LIPQFSEECNIVKKSYSYTTQMRKQNNQRRSLEWRRALEREAEAGMIEARMTVSPTVRIGICRYIFTATATETS